MICSSSESDSVFHPRSHPGGSLALLLELFLLGFPDIPQPLQICMKTETNHIRKTKAIYSVLVIARESATVTCNLAETQRQAEEWESFAEDKKEGSQCALIRGCWPGEARGS